MEPGSSAPGWRGSNFSVLLERQSCAQLFFVYAGMKRGVSIPPDFIRNARIGNRNIVMVRDPSNAFYQRGVSPEYPDIPSFFEWQAKVRANFSHARDVYCLGSSGGAYAALISGHFLKARTVFAFSPPVQLTESLVSGYRDPAFSDVATILAQSNGVSEYRVYFNQCCEKDRVAAELLRGLPGVQLLPQDGEGHLVLQHLIKTNQVVGMMPPNEKV